MYSKRFETGGPNRHAVFPPLITPELIYPVVLALFPFFESALRNGNPRLQFVLHKRLCQACATLLTKMQKAL
jgi:hypothetical protein